MKPGYFQDTDAIRDLASEPFTLLGGGPALLLQLAHPKVALGVAEHSGFHSSPLPRLLATLDYLAMVTFGDKEEAQRVAWSAMRAHDTVRGPTYSAHDPELLLWVQATLFQMSKELYERVFGKLEPARAEEYYQQSALLAQLLGAPREALPSDAAAFDAYWNEMVHTLQVGDTARAEARAVLFPRTGLRFLYPALLVLRLTTAGLLPEPIRVQYGLPWSPRRERLFGLLMAGVRLVTRLTVRPLRKLPVRLAVPVLRRFRWRRYRRPERLRSDSVVE